MPRYFGYILLLLLPSFLNAKEYIFVNNSVSANAFNYCEINLPNDKRSDVIISIRLTDENLRCLGSLKNDIPLTQNEPLVLERSVSRLGKADEKIYYLAKEDFGLIEYWAKNPTHDGRGVIAGVIDDGISPHQTGFQVTTDGQRKYLKHFSNSTKYIVKVVPEELDNSTLFGTYDEVEGIDVNLDNKDSALRFKVTVPRSPSELPIICSDLNLDDRFDTEECARPFNQSGEYVIVNGGLGSLMLEYDHSKKIVSFNEGESRGDSHGEGVASVLAGHNIGGKFDGVAPGAQLIDYDLSEMSNDIYESAYNIGKFLKAIELLAKNGASVVNISYSLYFSSLESQLLMAQAIDALSRKYECLVVFSAGNNGPGLGSLNRSAIYPNISLRVGAYVGQKLDAYVHGVTGLPEEGRVIYYSSRGPGAMGGMGPSLISPLASLTHADSRNGMRAFSGTSSAAPALAGFATVFMSAIKQSNREFNFENYVHAIRYSGRQIQGSPFVEQGFGLPNINKAIQIYDLLMREDMPRISNLVVDNASRWGSPVKGLVLKKSELISGDQYFAYITNQFLKTENRVNKVLPITIESSDFISTVDHSWLDHGTNRIGFSLDISSVDFSKTTELFGEIVIRDSVTQIPVAYIPITIIDDSILHEPIEKEITIGSEEGQRIHLNLDENTKGLRLFANMLLEDDERILVTLYNPHGIRINRVWLDAYTMNEFFFQVGEPGQYQIGISRSKGTSALTSFDLTIVPLRLSLSTNILTKEGKIKIQNLGLPTGGKVGLEIKNPSLKTVLVPFKQGVGYEFNWTPEVSGKFELDIEKLHDEFNYFSIRCFHQVGEEIISGFSIDEKSSEGDEHVETIKSKCLPFDFFPSREKGESLLFSWRSSVKKTIESPVKNLSRGQIQSFDLDLSELNGTLDAKVFFTPRGKTSKDSLYLGELEILAN